MKEFGGKLGKNKNPTSARAPHFRGAPIHIEEPGWYWISAWVSDGEHGEYLNFKAREVTLEERKAYLRRIGTLSAPKPSPAPTPAPEPAADDGGQDEIPF